VSFGWLTPSEKPSADTRQEEVGPLLLELEKTGAGYEAHLPGSAPPPGRARPAAVSALTHVDITVGVAGLAVAARLLRISTPHPRLPSTASPGRRRSLPLTVER
jgi:hypothetical protein